MMKYIYDVNIPANRASLNLFTSRAGFLKLFLFVVFSHGSGAGSFSRHG